ncbi:hypothetical protein CBR_g42048 [Chara braunii]|uniref:Uncharacterized protein n=1 Tax=Chara braunii TaxID=69332 RepID=A0A388LWR2_CHABU|nr:hypothetical protein CBR_g42048 [Chara braunii]|eukprot:GBG86764.1 hypothetical protein CBR_g42048 [Chara braunii]
MNLADTGAARGVQLAGQPGGRNDSGGSDGCGDGQDDNQGSTRNSSFSGGGVGGLGKRKNVRQQTFDTIADIMKDHGSLMATTVDSASKSQCSILTRQCDILERELEMQKEHYVKTDQANLLMCDAGGGKAQSAQKGDATAIDTRTAAADHNGKRGVAEGAAEERVDDVRRDDGRRYGKREGDDDDDRPLVTRLKGAAKEDGLEERSRLWVDCDSFWGQGPGKPLREAVGECADYFIVIANEDAGAEPPAMLILPPNDVPRFKIEDTTQREPALRRACGVEKLVLRAIHSWIFKSSSRSAGFARAESYISVDIAIDVT